MKALRAIPSLVLILAIVHICGPRGRAQFSSNVQGIVLDPSQAVIPNATVTLRNLDTQVERKTTTGASGVYRFSSLPPGRYEIRAEAEGFQQKRSPLIC